MSFLPWICEFSNCALFAKPFHIHCNWLIIQSFVNFQIVGFTTNLSPFIAFSSFQMRRCSPILSTFITTNLSSDHLWIFKMRAGCQIFPHSSQLNWANIATILCFRRCTEIGQKLIFFGVKRSAYGNFQGENFSGLVPTESLCTQRILCICMDPLQCQHVGEFSSVLLLWMSSRTLYKDVASLQCGWANVGQGLIIGLWSSRTICIDLVLVKNVFWCVY